jgi:FkbM family methyltransferase
MSKTNSSVSDIITSKEVFRLPNDIIIHHLNKSETIFLYKEIFENHTYIKNGISLRENAVVFDVGANIGMFTLFIQSTIPKSKVYAFEPIPEICQLLRLNTARFNADVVVYECGLSNKERSAVMTYYPGYSILSGLYANLAQDSEIFLSGATRQWQSTQKKQKGIPARAKELLVGNALGKEIKHVCKLTTISSVIREHNISHIDLLKIDVEKSEQDIVNGINSSDWPKIKQIVIEVHDFNGDMCEKMNLLLKEKGFTTIIEKDKELGSIYTPNIYAIRK